MYVMLRVREAEAVVDAAECAGGYICPKMLAVYLKYA
jgi:hypothetical protein